MRVLTVGGAMIDTIAIIASDAIEHMKLLNAGASFLLLEDGRKTEALEVSTHCGGGAINTAVAFARLGHAASALVKLGHDRRAEQILSCLGSEGVSPRWALRDEEAPTGASVLVSSHDRNAAVFTFRGANTRLKPADLSDSAFATDLVYIANLSQQAAHCFPVAVEKAKSAGAVVAANPGPRQLHAHSGAFEVSLPRIDILVLNRREADEVVSLLGPEEAAPEAPALSFPEGMRPPELAFRGLRAEGRRVSVGAFCRALVRRGVGTLVLTAGHDGAFAARDGRLYYCPPCEAEVVAGTAGAGDAFAATFAALAGEGRALPTALRAASVNAAGVLAYVDTQTGLLRRAELEAALGKNVIPNVMEWPL